MSECNHDCSSCGLECDKKSFMVPQNEHSNVKHVIAVMSGKGGVGKSFVSCVLASELAKRGYQTAILDADITGPSIPKAYGITECRGQSEYGIIPARTVDNIKVMSINLLLESQTQPVIWRGPVIAGTVKQFWNEVYWGEVDYMIVDMPPGTGDVPLTVFQSLPVEGTVIVTTPQDLVGMIIRKAFHMASMMDIPVLGLVENYSYLECPDCKKHINVFGESHVKETADELGIGKSARIPVNQTYASLCDAGRVNEIDASFLAEIVDSIEKK